jgi:heat shock protein HslJ
MKRFVVIVGLALSTAACLGSDFADSLEGSWQLSSGTVDGEPIPILDSHPISIVFDGEQVSGTASCNGYGGSYELSGSAISFGNLAMTEMACDPPETMEAEGRYAQGLTAVTTVAIDGDLILTGPDVELIFTALEPVPDAELTNTVWALDGLIRNDAVSSVAGEPATLEFFTDGSVLGTTGCRSFAGQYVVAGAEVEVTDLAGDASECDPTLTAQDEHVLTALGDGFTVDVEGNRLVVDSGELGLTYLAQE